MSKHHHHPHEGHRSGNPPGSGRPRHNWFFYVAGFFILIGLLCFIMLGTNFFWSPVVPATPPPASK
jgi:hypothetical protein